MSEHDISLVTSQAGSVISENQKNTLGQAAASLTPATLTAMIGIKNGTALTLAAPVANVIATLTTITGNVLDPNYGAATAALSSLNSFHASMGFGGTPNHAAFGSFLNQIDGHLKDAKELRKATDFMSSIDYKDFGAGITDMGSAADRGMTNVFGSLAAAGAAMTSTGTMYNGGDVKDFGSSVGMVKSLLDNKLATITGVKRRLASAGVPLDDLDNPIYKEKIDEVMSGITDPGAMSVVADQYDVAPEIADSDTAGDSTTDAILAKMLAIIDRINAGTDDIRTNWFSYVNDVSTWDDYNVLKANWPISFTSTDITAAFKEANEISLNEIKPLPDDEFKLQLVNFRNNDVESAMAEYNAAATELKGKIAGIKAMLVANAGPNPDGSSATTAAAAARSAVTTGFSLPSTAMGADLSPGQNLPMGAGGIQSLKDLGDPTKLNPEGTAGLASGISGLTTHLTDMGAGSIVDAGAAGSLFSQIQSIQTPLHSAAFPTLNSLVTDNQSTIDTLTGTGTGPMGLPSMSDFTQHLAGGPSITSFLQTVGTNASAAISALTSSLAGAVGLVATAGVDLTSPAPNVLGSAMSFAKNLHKFGADSSGSGVADVLHNLADTATAEGEAIKASLAEGMNNNLLAKNGIPPITTTPPPPVGQESTVEYPITISRQFLRKTGPGAGTFVTVSAVASSATNVLWRLENGDYTTLSGYGPYAVMYSGDYDTLYASAKERSLTTDPGISADVLEVLPQIKAEFDSQTSGKSPKALG
jgi:hypothetical protein